MTFVTYTIRQTAADMHAVARVPPDPIRTTSGHTGRMSASASTRSIRRGSSGTG
jgi:hypothetical protein